MASTASEVPAAHLDKDEPCDMDNISNASQSPIVFMKHTDEPAYVTRHTGQDLDRRETHVQEPALRRRTSSTQCYIPSGLVSELFKPLWIAVYRPKLLQKRTIAGADIERICIALLTAAKTDERPFPTVGCHIKGLCVILAQKITLLLDDANILSKKLMISTTVPGTTRRAKVRKGYVESDDDYEMPKRKRTSAKSRKAKKRMLALEDYYEEGYGQRNGERPVTNGDGSELDENLGNQDSDYMPVEQIEVLQLMNFGIGMGVGTDIAFYSSSSANREHGISYHNFEHGMVDRQPMSLEDLRHNRETIRPDSFLDLQSLSSPFKLNGYSFTPQTRVSQELSDAATTIASTELSLQSDSVMLSTPESGKYDLDWDIYNDALRDIEEHVMSEDRTGSELVPSNTKDRRRMVLEYTEPDGKAVHLVKSKRVARYDTKVTSTNNKTPKKVKLPKEQTTIDTFTVSPQAICDKTQWFNSAIDSLVKSVIGHMPDGNEPSNNAESDKAKVNGGQKRVKPAVELPSTKQGDKWFKRVEREVAKSKHHKSTVNVFDNETVSTVQVIEGYRKCVRDRQNAAEPIELAALLKGRSKENAALIFYRTLVLANADFIALSQEDRPGAQIAVTPARRFWEPIHTCRDLKV
ncbi:uncharacterized protein BXIN_2484 [Babesia sp. Xinjiang]|uniref:uncharacterized protein n=1 Tax=Babesia sp. Xinjiang TaxID=462227 RepID=UPI000A25E3BF|nr:uncharacterized protein BXIN_2484 [Babesia sp. Xinjiang]ORM41536.1 hypothetical protein BXIN_2484 [Babesia sp. Xinjiang]